MSNVLLRTFKALKWVVGASEASVVEIWVESPESVYIIYDGGEYAEWYHKGDMHGNMYAMLYRWAKEARADGREYHILPPRGRQGEFILSTPQWLYVRG